MIKTLQQFQKHLMNDPSERCKWPCCVVIMALIPGPFDRQIKLPCPQTR
jgi:hypothetical protein